MMLVRAARATELEAQLQMFQVHRELETQLETKVELENTVHYILL